MKKALSLIFSILFALSMQAQTDPEYRAEVGGGVGLVNYLGDFNGNITKNMQPMGSLIGKYRFNPRMAIGMNLSFGKLKGDNKNVTTYYPALNDTALTFNNTLVDVGFRFEYNFWPYGTGREYFGAKPLTPFVAMGLGITYAKAGNSVVSANVPIGFGVKYKIADRLNLTAEWAMHFSLSDKLDGVEDPYTIKSSGLFKNTDCYGTLQLSLTYDIWAKCKVCNKE
jgi:hypothetical protein